MGKTPCPRNHQNNPLSTGDIRPVRKQVSTGPEPWPSPASWCLPSKRQQESRRLDWNNCQLLGSLSKICGRYP